MITVYGFDGCPYCQKAKRLLESSGIQYEYNEIPTLEERTAWLDERGFVKPKRTFPKIYDANCELIGGFDDLEAHLFMAGL